MPYKFSIKIFDSLCIATVCNIGNHSLIRKSQETFDYERPLRQTNVKLKSVSQKCQNLKMIRSLLM